MSKVRAKVCGVVGRRMIDDGESSGRGKYATLN
jgi:hypothetical protein